MKCYALQPNDPLLGYIFQPRLIQPYLRLLRRQIAPAALLALTQNEVILIEEGPSSATRYGWYFTFCPRTCITGIDARPDEKTQDIQVHLKRASHLASRQIRLENNSALAWQSLWQTLSKN